MVHWKVKFTTNGTADLVITAINGTTFGTESPDDLNFLELNNGTHTLIPIVNGNTITYYNYSSTGEGFEESQVLTAFKHHLMFQFGEKTAFAHNSAFVPNGPKVILLHGTPEPLSGGSLETEDDLALTTPIIPGWDELADRQDSIFVHSPTGDGCNGVADSCTEIQVTEAGTYRVSYGMTGKVGTMVDARWSAISFVQNRTDGGSYNANDGVSCYDGTYRRTTDTIDTVTFTGECLLDLAADDHIRVGLSKVTDGTASTSFDFATDKNWLHMQKVENPTVALRANNESLLIDSGSGIPMTFVDADIITYDTSTFTFDGSTADSEIAVNEDGFYKVTYSVADVDTNGRKALIGKIQVNDGGGFVTSEYGGSTGYSRDQEGFDQGAYSASTILELTDGDIIQFISIDITNDSPSASDYHLDVEFLGPASSANVLRIHDSTGGVDLNSATDYQFDWDTSDEIGSHFTFTGDTTPTDEITVANNGVYHISYGIDADIENDNDRWNGQTRLQVDSGSGFVNADACYGAGFARQSGSGFSNAIAESSCLLELEADDKIRVVSVRTGDALDSNQMLTATDESYLTMHSLTISNPPLLETLEFSDTVQSILIKSLPETLSFSDALDTDHHATVLLVETLTLIDDPVLVQSAGVINVSFIETLTLDDAPIVNVLLPVKPQETLSFSDALDTDHIATISLTESLTFNDGSVIGEPFTPANPDFKIQHGTVVLLDSGPSAGTVVSITEGTDFEECVGDCFIRLVSTRHTGMGANAGGNNQDSDDSTVYISNDSGLTTTLGTVTFTRHDSGENDDNFLAWEIIEYIGPDGGPNEMKVLGTGSVNLLATDATEDGTSSTPVDGADVSVLVTGVSNYDTGRAEVPSGMVTTEWIGSGTDAPRITRTSTDDEADVSYAVVEWSGVNWNLQRITHEGSDLGSEQTETIDDIGDLSRAFILQAQQRNADSTTADGNCEVGEMVWLSDTDELSFTHEVGTIACTYTSEMNSVVYVLSNSETKIGKKIIVEHQQPTDQINTGGASEKENWQRSINTLTYGTDETSILGLSSTADDINLENPVGNVVAMLTDSTTVDFWQSERKEEVKYSFSVVQWPRSSSLSISFTETLSFSTKAVALQEKEETLSLSDTVEAIKDAQVSLEEYLSLNEEPVGIRINDGEIIVSFSETLSFNDGSIENLILPIKLQESLSFNDVVDVDHDITLSITETLTFSDVVEIEKFVSSNPDFKIQRGTSDTSFTGLTYSITEGTDFEECVGDCFIMLTSTRQTGMGATSGGGEQFVDDVSVYISDDDGLRPNGGNNVEFTREGSGTDVRIAWEIIEYIGPAGGPNEMKVLDNGTAAFSTTDLDKEGDSVSGGATNDDDVAVIITGVSGESVVSDEYEGIRVTSEWRGASNVPVFNRTATTANTVNVSYAVVEWTGSQWSLERIEHEGADAPSPVQTETITDVGDLSRAFILQAQQRNADGADGPCETGETVWLSDTNELSFIHEVGTVDCTYNSDMNSVVWILSNSNTETGKKMIVEHQQPSDQLTIGGGNEDNWQVTTNALTYGTDETSILGFAATTDDVITTEHPHGTVVAMLTDSTTVDFWQSDDNEQLSYSFSVVQWPRSKVLSIAFSETLSFSDNTSINLSVALTESLTFNDGVIDPTKQAAVALTESLTFNDETVDTTKAASVSLTELLTLFDNINKNIPISLTESLTFNDGTVDTTKQASVALKC